MAEVQLPLFSGNPAYEGSLNRRSQTIAERLREIGYSTMLSGKWHLGTDADDWPVNRGFDRSFALLNGSHNHFGADQTDVYAHAGGRPEYVEGDKHTVFPVGEYSSDYFADRMIEFLDEAPSDRPFFAYLAFTAPHWPLQAPEAAIEKYDGFYDGGPAALREERLQRLRSLGLLDKLTTPSPIIDTNWNQLTDDERAFEVRRMQIYAAMVDRMDFQLGRVLQHLHETGKFENTIVLFISDNGPDGNEFNQPRSMDRPVGIDVPFDNSLANLGRASSFIAHGHEWATAAAAPLRGMKASAFEGGIHGPMVIAGPGIEPGRRDFRTSHVLDILPTLMEIAAGDRATDGAGRSLATVNLGDRSTGLERTLYWELFFQRAIRRGDWKAVYSPPIELDDNGKLILRKANWKLFDLAEDPGETKDLSTEYPVLMSDLVSEWFEFAREHGIITELEDSH